jgi:hypothetical protein
MRRSSASRRQKQELEYPPSGYPSSRTVRRHFGSFTAGLRAAGLEPRERRWSAEAIIEAMREYERETDFWPRSSDWAVACEDWPSMATVYNRFLDGLGWDVLVVETGAENQAAALKTQAALFYLEPAVALFVGVAGGSKKRASRSST